MAVNKRWGKIVYGLLFVLVLPIGLRFWTDRLVVGLPVERAPVLGLITIFVGAFLAVWGMMDLWFIGRGLPMNAYPPPIPVRRGLYGIAPHPIYVGFVACVVGESIRIGSAAGLWITAPLVALGCLALVAGFEGPELHKRFGREALPEPWLGMPSTEGVASLATRVGTLVWTGSIWGLAYFGIKAFGVPRQALETLMPWEWNIPILPFTMMFYASVYLVVPLAFLVESDKKRLRCLSIGALLATCLNTLFYLVLPLTAVFRVARPEELLSRWMDWEQRMAIPAAGCFPSFHATWAVLAVWSLGRGRSFASKSVWVFWCVVLCASCLTTGMHSIADVAAGAMVGLLAARHEKIWRGILDRAEILGNSWKAWNLCGLRIMSHGIWSGLAGAVGIVVIGSAAGSNLFGWVLVVAAMSLIGACLWAQWVEGSAALLRPFGYYGSIFGGLVAIVAIWLLNGPAGILMGAFAVASPWVQAVGRMRCVVQGCCHGRPVSWGIRVTNPHSRVVKLAGFQGVPIHPTPVYSILGNLAIGLLLTRLWLAGSSAIFLAGLYMVLSGFLRFVEEAYRGEPQTRSYFQLALYQWLAIFSVGLGMALMILPSGETLRHDFPSLTVDLAAVCWGLVSAFAMSMDFPKSTVRFSRLTG